MKTKYLQIPAVIILILSHLLITTSAFSQAPQKLSYQSIIRNAGGGLVKNSNIGIRIQILQGSEFGGSVYVETHTANTNENGLLTLPIGGGNAVFGNFSTINWGSGPYFIKTETDPTGGTNYSIAGTSELLSVPYALYSGSSVPVGSIIMYSGAWNFSSTGLGTGTLAGWALCNGSNGTPDLSERFVMGTKNSSTLMATGGASTFKLTTNMLPSHVHDFTTSGAGSHSHSVSVNGGGSHSHTTYNDSWGIWSNANLNYGLASVNNNPERHYYPANQTFPDNSTTSTNGDHSHSASSGTTGSHAHSGTTNSTGSGADIDNRPAFLKLAFIMKL